MAYQRTADLLVVRNHIIELYAGYRVSAVSGCLRVLSEWGAAKGLAFCGNVLCCFSHMAKLQHCK